MRKYVIPVENRFCVNVKADGTDSQRCALNG